MKTRPKYQQQPPAEQPERDTENILIDWLKIKAKNYGRWKSINAGVTLRIDEHGERQWQTEAHRTEKGSHNSSAQLRVTYECLELSFNPSRWNRSNNLFGCTYEQAIQTADRILDSFNLKPMREFDLTRMDITQNRSTGGPGQLDAYIRHLKKQKLARKNTFTKYDSAIYQNKQVKITVYKKAEEIRAHNDKMMEPETLRERLRIADHCQQKGVARIEVRLNRQALIQRGLRQGHKLNHSKIVEAFMKETKEIPMSTEEANTIELGERYLGTLLAWKAGYNTQEMMSRNTWYERRRVIKEKTGYDIGSENPTALPEKRTIIKTTVLQIPDWYKMPFDEEEERHLKPVT